MSDLIRNYQNIYLQNESYEIDENFFKYIIKKGNFLYRSDLL